MTSSLSTKVKWNTTNINQLLEENRSLRKENSSLREQITRIEISQMSNNIILSGMPEEPWESYESTKGRVVDTTATTMGSRGDQTVR